jgi:hypothetical protein
VTFSEPINPLSVNVNAFMISPASQSHLFFSNGNTTLTFIPIEPLPLNSLITVTLGAGISDMAGNGMPSSFASTFFTGASLDNGQPSVVTVSPYQTYYNQTDVPLNSDITILFDRRIDPESVDHSSFYVQWSDRYNNIGITDIDGALSVAPDGLTAALVPSQRLLPNVTYCVSYTAAIKDIAGNPLYNPGNSCFTTGSVPNDVTAPRVIAVSPVNGAKNVPLNAEVMIQFSEAIDETTIRNNNVIVSKAGIQVEGWLTTEQDSTVVRYRAANSMNFDPSTFYQLTVTTGVKDTAGNTLPQPFTSGFTTGAAADAQKLHVASIVPADNATNVSPDSTIEITFTKQIDPVTINENTVWWYPGVRGSHTLSADGKTLTFTPFYPLFRNLLHVVSGCRGCSGQHAMGRLFPFYDRFFSRY